MKRANIKPDIIEYKKEPDSEESLKNILHPIVKDWFFSRFPSFSLPQRFGVMEIHSRKNVLISAPTGATKTLTGFLAILNELVDNHEKGILEDKVYAIYISPLKALNNDIEKNLREPLAEMERISGKKINIRIAVRTGDTTQGEKSKMLKNPPHILITTPESLSIVLSSIKFRDHLKDVQWCIIDEIHALADSKRGVHLSLSLERLSYLASHMARIGLSATVAPLEEVAGFLCGDSACTIIDVDFTKQMDLKVLCPVGNLMDVTHKELQHHMYVLIDELIQEHKTTLIFTNTRAATERIVDHLKEKYPKNYSENIGAHHGSLSKELRTDLEKRLREGKLRAVVCSTSLELGIDIGYIDLVICIGSPKSVARALQRIGRSGHNMNELTKGRFIVLNEDDLVECSVLLKSAIDRKIDRISVPKNCLDVLAQQIFGMAIEQRWDADELLSLIRKSYCYRDLSKDDYISILHYLSGSHVSLTERHVYAKIWYDPETNMIGKKGRMARVLYMTNIGTIPEEAMVIVKVGDYTIGTVDEGFLERLKPGDKFVLGGSTYEFRSASGMVARVVPSGSRPPTVPRWFSDSLPLSFDLAMEISRFRRLLEDRFNHGNSKEEIIEFINSHLHLDNNSAIAIYDYFRLQYDYAEIPSDLEIVVEHIDDGRAKRVVFHTLFGRRVNDVLSRAIAFIIGRAEHKDVEILINDNAFSITYASRVNVMKAFRTLKSEKLRELMNISIDRTEVLKRRFRHCATRALMILRTYKGQKRRVGRQQVSSMIMINAARRVSEDFPILKEARREVLEDLMDITNAETIVHRIETGQIKVKEISSNVPSPFAFNLVIQGYSDIMKMEDRMEFLRRMHQHVVLKTRADDPGVSEIIGKEPIKPFAYEDFWDSEDVTELPVSERYSLAGRSGKRVSDGSSDTSAGVIPTSEMTSDDKISQRYSEDQNLTEDVKAESYRERLLSDLKSASNRIGLDPMIRNECERLLKGDVSGFKRPFLEWLSTLIEGDVPEIWSKDLVTALRNRYRIIKK